jgi:hypothetical protein
MTPRLGIEPFAAEGRAGAWVVRWRVTNLGVRPVNLLTATQPHAQFRTADTAIPRALAPGEETEISLPVQFAEQPGAVVENPFLIVRFADEEGAWRALARVRVTAASDGRPTAGPLVVVTSHRVSTDAEG